MEEIDLKELFTMFWNKKIYIILIVAILMLVGIIYTACFVTPMYKSSTSLVLAQINGENATSGGSITASDINVNSKLVSNYSELIKSKSILRTVISNLNIDMNEETLKKNVQVSSKKDTELIEITVSNEDKDLAARIANELAQVFMEKIAKGIYHIENVQVVDMAEPENEPYNVTYSKNVIIFAGIGIVISATYILVLNMLDTTIKSAEEIENVYQIPVLASVPLYEENAQKNKKGGKR